MKFLKNNLKLILGFIIGIVLAGGIVYATTSASQITYKDNKTVEFALNDLYEKSKYCDKKTVTFPSTRKCM